MNVKKVVYILIAIMLVFFSLAFLSWKFTGSETHHSKAFDEKITKDISEVNKIYLKSNFAQINISSEDREDISIHYYGKTSPKIETNLTTNLSKDQFTIEAKSKNKFTINFGTNIDLYLDIIIPTSYENNLNIETDLGSINVENLKLKELDIKSELGKISLFDVSSDENRLSSELGEIKVQNSEGNIKVETELGSIILDYNDLAWNIDTSSEMGSIELTLPKESSFTLDASSKLGSIKSNFPLTNKDKNKDITSSTLKGLAGNGKNTIRLSVEMGSIDIKSK